MAKANAAARPVVELSNLPVNRLPHFVGRESYLADLAATFAAGQRVQVVVGLGGIGKTQTSLEYARRHRAEYGLVWLVRAETRTSLVESFSKLAAKLGRAMPEDASAEFVRDAVHGALAVRQNWLIIFDAAPDLASMADLIPPGEGRVLITTRNAEVSALGKAQPLAVLERAESSRFLRQRTSRSETDSDTDRLARALGDLPLALEQAGAVIVAERLSFSAYLNRFETQWADMLGSGPPPSHYPHTVAMTWGLAFSSVEAQSPAAASLLNFAAYLCPDHVSNKMLRDGHAHLPDSVAAVAQNPIMLEKAMVALGNFSLVQRQSDAIVIHRLVATVTRDRLKLDEQRWWCGAAIEFLRRQFQFDSADLRTWKKCGELLPHVIDTTAHADRLDVELDTTANLLNDAGRYLLKKAQFVDARQALNLAMALNSRRYGESHPKLSAIANNLGRVYEQMGDDAVAVRFFEQALTIDQSAYGAEHPHVAEVINNYGICIQKQGDREQARDKFAFAAQVYESHYGPNHPKLANILNNLGYALQSIGDTDAAEPHLLRALTIAEESVGPEHPTTACILYNLASGLAGRHEMAAARVHLERAFGIDSAALGPDHPRTRRDAAALSRFKGLPSAVS